MLGAIRCLSACSVALLTIFGLNACGQGGAAIVVATVEGTAITKPTLDHWTSIEADPAVSRPTGATPREAALGLLISSAWTVAEAARLGARATDAEAEKQLDRFRYVQLEKLAYERFPDEAQLRRSLASRRETRADQVWLMKLNMLAARTEAERLAQLKRQITSGQVASYYAQNRRQFFVPEQRDIDIVLTYNKVATERAKREILAGKSFLSVARRVSVDAGAPDGTQHLVRGRGELTLLKYAFAAKPHVVSGPFKQALSYYVLKVTRVTPAYYRPLTGARKSIVSLLAAKQQRASLGSLIASRQRTWTVLTSCRPGYVVAKCRQYTGRTPSTSSAETDAGVQVTTKRIELGRVLGAGADGRTVYLYEGDKGSTPECYGACAKIWPPVTTAAPPTVGGEAIPRDLGTVKRADGATQVTYFHHPLYYYSKDRSSREARGQGVESFGSSWYALRPIGVRFEPWGE